MDINNIPFVTPVSQLSTSLIIFCRLYVHNQPNVRLARLKYTEDPKYVDHPCVHYPSVQSYPRINAICLQLAAESGDKEMASYYG